MTSKTKGSATPLVRTTKIQKSAAAQKERDDLAAAADLRKAKAARLAQMINLHIAGYSFADIAEALGATVAEVENMVTADTATYIKSQPALRIYVRNWISEKYAKMIEADWDEASDANAPGKLENQDRVMRMLDKMERLHGAAAPSQTEIKVDAAPEAVEALVQALAGQQGMGYDVDVFDTVPGTLVHDMADEATKALTVSGNQIEEGEPDGYVADEDL